MPVRRTNRCSMDNKYIQYYSLTSNFRLRRGIFETYENDEIKVDEPMTQSVTDPESSLCHGFFILEINSLYVPLSI